MHRVARGLSTVLRVTVSAARVDPTQTNGASATVGIQGTDTSPPVWALQYPCDSQSLSSGLAVVFAPPGAQTGGIPNECVVPVDLMSFTAEQSPVS
jgi:hypothetical protein